ncbi:MAG: alternative ribosome rescue aminoacyl-tRNA hydrolase ArfB [Pseudomonadota bacterium]
MFQITDTITIQDWELTETFQRASGPGGQNVNKVNSAVTLRFEAARSPHLTPPVKARLKRLSGQKWTTDGAIILQVDTHRSQAQNREAARKRLKDLITSALKTPKKRVKTRPSASAIRRRLDAKSKRAETKSLRAKPRLD